MIKCPKCGFSQPEDIYCASCGIKMDSYARKHKASGLATNWMVHVMVLIILIIGFVLYDKITSRKPKGAVTSQSVPAANDRVTGARGRQESASDTSSESNRQRPGTNNTASSAPVPQSPASGNATAGETSETPAPEVSEAATAPTRNERRGTGLQISFYRISKQGIGEIQKISQAINISGDSAGGIIGSARIQQLVTSGDMQYVSGNRYKDFDEKHPTVVFKGQRHPEAARNMGLFFQVTSLRKSEASQLIEIKGWGALKANDPDENYFTGEMTLTPRTAAFITGFLPKKGSYSEDEKQLFESDRVLKTLNQEDFNDGSTDIIMFIEFAKSN